MISTSSTINGPFNGNSDTLLALVDVPPYTPSDLADLWLAVTWRD